MAPIKQYLIKPDPDRPTDAVIVTHPDGREQRIYQEDADPEHRFTSYRLAAGWFGNLPAGYDPET